jgi:hypothetical protein
MYEENRDIAIVNATPEPFDRMRKLTDSTFFADSVNYQDDLDLMMLVHTDADERDPCLSADGEYLYYSSDHTGIFNIYRMSLTTWKVEQVTNVLGGAFAPSIHQNGRTLLYTGFHAADYSIYEVGVAGAEEASLTYRPRSFRERHTDPLIFAAEPKDGQYREEKYAPRFTLWHLGPYLSFQPAFVTDTVGFSHLRTGINMLAGELGGAITMGGDLYLGKDFRNRAGPSWGAAGFLGLAMPSIAGENVTLKPTAFLFGAREVIREEEQFKPEYTGDLAQTPPNEESYLVPGDPFVALNAPDTLIGMYLDFLGGTHRQERVVNQYGIAGSLAFDEHNALSVHYSRIDDYAGAEVFRQQARLQARVYTLQAGDFDNAVDLTDTVLQDPTDYLYDVIQYFSDTGGVQDVAAVRDRFNVYNDHSFGIHYRFLNIRPAFWVPSRLDLVGVSAEFIRSGLTVGSVSEGTDTILGIDTEHEVFASVGTGGRQVAHLIPVVQTYDLVRAELSLVERTPLPGNTFLSSGPRGVRARHFFTGSAFFGSLNRRLPKGTDVYPLQYRTSDFLKAYPYSFDPFDPVEKQDYFTAYNVITGETDTLTYTDSVDASNEDILWGNGIMYYGVEYNLEIFRGLTFRPFGVLLKGVYLSPFFELAAVWNRNWRDFELSDLVPFTSRGGSLRRRDSFLRDAGLRVDLPLVILDTWEGLLSFTWAHRLDLDKEVVSIKRNGDKVHLDRDRFSFVVHLW